MSFAQVRLVIDAPFSKLTPFCRRLGFLTPTMLTRVKRPLFRHQQSTPQTMAARKFTLNTSTTTRHSLEEDRG